MAITNRHQTFASYRVTSDERCLCWFFLSALLSHSLRCPRSSIAANWVTTDVETDCSGEPWLARASAGLPISLRCALRSLICAGRRWLAGARRCRPRPAMRGPSASGAGRSETFTEGEELLRALAAQRGNPLLRLAPLICTPPSHLVDVRPLALTCRPYLPTAAVHLTRAPAPLDTQGGSRVGAGGSDQSDRPGGRVSAPRWCRGREEGAALSQIGSWAGGRAA